MRGDAELHLRRYLAARKVGDTDAMATHWNTLFTINLDRFTQRVKIVSLGHLDDEEREEARQRAAILHTTRLMWDFRGVSMGEWWNATKQLIYHACLQEQDARKAISKHETSLDKSRLGDDGDPVSGYDSYLRGEQAERDARAHEAEELEAEMDVGRGFLDWALPQLSGKLREVAIRDRAGMPVEQIMEELGLKQDAVYKRRERYTDRLDELGKSYES